MTPEHRIQDAIMKYLSVVEQLDSTAFFCRTNTAKGMFIGFAEFRRGGVSLLKRARGINTGREGLPDISGCFRGKPCYIEVKATNGRLGDEQELVHTRLRNGGAMVIVARSVEDVEEHLIPRKRVPIVDVSDVPF